MSSPSAAHETIALDQQVTDLLAMHGALAPGERSCCCAARPGMRVVLPATPQRDHPVDLLLCRHHYRHSLDALAAADARVFDVSG